MNEALLLWEISPTPYEEVADNYEFGIVLGGISNSEKSPRDRVYFFKGADRITHTLQLYKLKKIKKILVSGGSSKLMDTQYKEADNLLRFLLLTGVREEDIWVESRARNTYENAIFSEELLKENFSDKRHLVITSGFHLRRALLCFKKTNLHVDGFSTDFYSKDRSFNLQELIIPDVSAFSDWQLIIRELEGMLFYQLAGYI